MASSPNSSPSCEIQTGRPFLGLYASYSRFLVLFFADARLMPLNSEPPNIMLTSRSYCGGEAWVILDNWFFSSLLWRRFFPLSEKNSQRYPFFNSSLTSSSVRCSIIFYECGRYGIHTINFYSWMLLLLSYSEATWPRGPSASERWPILVLRWIDWRCLAMSTLPLLRFCLWVDCGMVFEALHPRMDTFFWLKSVI